MKAPRWVKPRKWHVHKCAGCGVGVSCSKPLHHETRCAPCFDQLTDSLLFGERPAQEGMAYVFW